MQEQPSEIKVSVIMPSLNVAKYIGKCLDSVIGQTLSAIEILCIDAGSDDGTAEIISEYKTKENRIKYFDFAYRSYGAQVNFGIETAQGKYVAVLETDDYISKEMYETLYNIAEEYNVDYAKSNFNKFFIQDDGNYNFSVSRQFDRNDLYGKVLNPHKMDYLYKSDYNIWRGIYRKEFLIENKILLNNTKGAAYQDIGFMERLLAKATRAVYIDKPLYYYQIDRYGASSFSENALKNTQVEFCNLLQSHDEDIYWAGLYQHMMSAFLNESEKTLARMDYNAESIQFNKPYEWFKNKIENAVDSGIISYEMLGTNNAKALQMLLYSKDEYVRNCEWRNKSYGKFICKCCNENGLKCLIFGAGKKGYETSLLLKGACEIAAFIDNDTKKQGLSIDGIPVMSFEDAINVYTKSVIVIANEKYYQEIYNQIKSYAKEILICCPYDMDLT